MIQRCININQSVTQSIILESAHLVPDGREFTSRGVPLVEFMYLVFTGMPGESYRRRLGSWLLRLCDVFRELINSLVC